MITREITTIMAIILISVPISSSSRDLVLWWLRASPTKDIILLKSNQRIHIMQATKVALILVTTMLDNYHHLMLEEVTMAKYLLDTHMSTQAIYSHTL